MIRKCLLLALLLTQVACKIQVTVPPGGRVLSASGNYACEAGQVCSIDVSGTNFDEVFVARADDQHLFAGWRTGQGFFCGGSQEDCRLVTTGFPGNEGLMDVLRSNRVFHLEPVFEPASRFVVAGELTPATVARADGDVNDSATEYRPNDSIGSAQPLPNPVNLGGYANVIGVGAEGPSTDFGDRDDYFVVELLQGQVLSLVVAEPEQGDLDLYLYDEAGYIVDFSLETGFLEQLVVPGTGRYYVNVYAYSGASNYTLSIGLDSWAQGQPANLNARVELEPDIALVKYRQSAAAASGAASRSTLGRLSREPLQDLLRPGRPAAAAMVAAKSRVGPFVSSALERKWQTLLAIKAMAKHKDVEFAEPNLIYRTTQVLPNDPLYALQWHYRQINLPGAWEISRGSRDVIVATLDSGILLGHPDLQGQLVGGYDFVSDPYNAFDGDGIDPDPSDPGQGDGVQAASYHGTHVAGTVAARSANAEGVVGVGWSTRVMPVRVLAESGGTTYDVIQGLKFVAQLPNDSGTVPPQAADVVNMSLGGEGYSIGLNQAVQELRAKGIIVVAASGNENTSRPFYPAAYEGVIAVGAVDQAGQRSPYSNYGAHLDLVAPGGDASRDLNGDGYLDAILSTSASASIAGLRYDYDFLQGTSMAAPHVAGVLALMKAVRPSLTPAQVDNLIRQGAMTQDVGASGYDIYHGHGLLDARKALVAVRDLGSGSASPALNVTPRSLSLQDAQTGSFYVSNSGTGGLRITGVEGVAPWLSVSAVDVDGNGLGRYRVSIVAGQLPPGVYESEVSLRSSAGVLRLPVLATVNASVGSPSVGTVYVLLINRFGEVADEQVIYPLNGRYRFRFNSIKEGQYTVLAGSDMDNDYFICDEGESCGAYLTPFNPKVLQVNQNRGQVNFSIQFANSLFAASQAQPEMLSVRRGLAPEDAGSIRGGERGKRP